MPSTAQPINHGCSHPSNPRQLYLDHLAPYGTPLPPIDTSKVLRICMQKPQHSFQIYGDTIDLPSIVTNLQSVGANMYIPISPNVNWNTSSTWPRTHHLFCSHFYQVHLSAVSSDIGKNSQYFNKPIVGGAAIQTFGQWASKIQQSFSDSSGFGTFTVTTIQGKGKKHLSIISAYIAIQK